MKFNNLFKKTMESLEEATLSFWIMCLIVFLLSIGQGYINNFLDMCRPIIGSSCLEEHGELFDMSTDETMEYEDEIEVEYVDDGEHWYMNGWEYLKTSWVWLLEMVVAVLLMPIIYYYGMAFAIESVEKQPIVKGKNLCKVILAQLLFSLIGIIIACCSIALIWMGASNHEFILCLLGMLIVLAGLRNSISKDI